ncbi:MAG TPA: SUMF1/EgtB/PvdO family nonheme iron enzyme [Anaerolineae bacterium]|nr:SUMF1/EgtB/PvdO family nonheme iron enzyme [Anaerolineae bacterium]
MPKPNPQIDWIGQTIGNRYKIESFIGQGGMSSVYKAADPNLSRTVAIKVIHPHLSNDPQFLRRFEHEAAAVARLRHPNIIQVYDFNHENNVYYMVMEYIPGQDLKEQLKSLSSKHQRLPLAETVRIMGAVCEAVSYAHEQNMIHRDLKPANIMINPQGQPILTDFGVAKMLDGLDHTVTGAIIGTAKYLSPEQAKGERPDERSDVYSLGVMLYEMLAGRPPFDADTTVAVLMKHVNEPVPDIRQIQSDIPEALIRIVEKALEKDKNKRYQSAIQLAVALKTLNLNVQPAEVDEAAKKTVASFRMADYESERAKTDESIRRQAVPAPVAPVSATKSSSSMPILIGVGAVVLLAIIGLVAFLAFSLGSSSDGEPGVVETTSQPTAEQAQVTNGSQEETGQATATNSGESGTEATQDTSQVAQVAEEGPAVDPNLPSSVGMIQIPGNAYSVGVLTADRDHAAAQQVDLESFWLDQYETTNAQYAEFLADTGGTHPESWIGGNIPADQESFPVMGVTWDEAAAYCAWAKKRLPTEAEWEVAARGSEGRLFPWGDNFRAVELPRSGTYKVGGKATNQSPFGVFDMAGNVWEWVDEPYAPLADTNYKVLRGGSNDFLKDMAYRLQGEPTQPTMIASAGIRCAADEVNIVRKQTQLAENIYLEDTFDDPGSGWPILAEGTYLFGYHPPDYYHVEVSNPEDFTAVSRPPNFTDVTVESDVQVDHTTTEEGDFRYGLVLRRTSANEYYAFTISSRSSTWSVLKSSADGLEVLDEGQVSTLQGFAPLGFTPSTSDNLRVDASGDNFEFVINNEIVSRVSDSDYTGGEVGFFVETFDEPLAHIHFDKLVIRQADLIEADEVSDANILFQDTFSNPESGWPEENKEDDPYRVGYHPPGYYHIEVSDAEDSLAETRGDSFDNASVDADLFVDFTDTEEGDFRYGLMLRRQAADKFYAFTISSRSGSWYILKETPSGRDVLAEGSVDTLTGFAPPGFSPNTSDNLRVDANGEDFVFYINDEPMIRIQDDAYDSGEIGFFLETFDETLAHIHYDTLTVRKVDPAAIEAVPLTTAEAEDTLPTETTEPTVEIAATEAPVAAEPVAEEQIVSENVTEAAAFSSNNSEDMIEIPAGRFLMGSETGEPDESPEHEVYVDAFYMDKYEVSNAEYRACVTAGGCTQIEKADSASITGYRDDPTYDNYPALAVTWDQAVAYCQWSGKRLPTEAEWEYAAGGPDNLTFPWGNEFVAEYSAAVDDEVQPVDAYATDNSPFGLRQMAGNVGEWVQDVYDENFYANSPTENPLNTTGDNRRIHRGGTFGSTDPAYYTTSRRFVRDRADSKVWIGLRCVQSK